MIKIRRPVRRVRRVGTALRLRKVLVRISRRNNGAAPPFLFPPRVGGGVRGWGSGGGGGAGGRFQDLVFGRVSKSVRIVDVAAAAAPLFYVFETVRFRGHFQSPFFQIIRKTNPDLKTNGRAHK